MYYTVMKHDGHLRTRGKCRKHELQFSTFIECSQMTGVYVLPQSAMHGLGFFIRFKI